jgi:glycosyltransferase involved in cell wall biosynthesis
MQDIQTTVVIPCYRQAHWVNDAVTSVMEQTVPCEVIVVDDGSDDDVLDAVCEWIGHIHFKYVRKENGGLSSARNYGISLAETKYVLTLDADDKILPNFVEKCLEADDDIVSTAQQEFGDSDKLWDWQPEHPRHADFLSDNQINCCSLQLKEIWEEVGGYDETMKVGYEDWFYWMKATKLGYGVTVIKDPLFLYRKHGRSMVNNAFDKHEEIKNWMLENIITWYNGYINKKQ